MRVFEEPGCAVLKVAISQENADVAAAFQVHTVQ
jgi:hypothetical protein